MQVAFFDLDGTLFTGHVWRALADHHRSQHTHRLHLTIYLMAHMGLWGLHRARLVSEQAAYGAWVRHMSWLMAGFGVERGREIFRRICDEAVVPQLRPDTMELLRQHQADGHAVVLVSGTFQEMLEVIARRLELQGAVGTRLQARNGRYTGGIVEPACFGGGKLARVREYLAEHPNIELPASFAYGDSIYDLPLLEAVGHPTVVYPDTRLAAIAGRRQWPIVGHDQDRL